MYGCGFLSKSISFLYNLINTIIEIVDYTDILNIRIRTVYYKFDLKLHWQIFLSSIDFSNRNGDSHF